MIDTSSSTFLCSFWICVGNRLFNGNEKPNIFGTFSDREPNVNQLPDLNLLNFSVKKKELDCHLVFEIFHLSDNKHEK